MYIKEFTKFFIFYIIKSKKIKKNERSKLFDKIFKTLITMLHLAIYKYWT